MQVTIIPPLLVSEAAAELLQARGLRVQQGLVRPTEPDEQAEHGDDDGQGHPELDLVLDHHVGGHGGAARGLQVLGAALLVRLAGENIVRVIQYNFRINRTIFPRPKLFRCSFLCKDKGYYYLRVKRP